MATFFENPRNFSHKPCSLNPIVDKCIHIYIYTHIYAPYVMLQAGAGPIRVLPPAAWAGGHSGFRVVTMTCRSSDDGHAGLWIRIVVNRLEKRSRKLH